MNQGGLDCSKNDEALMDNNARDDGKCTEAHKLLLEQFSTGYKQTWENKTSLESKAAQIISISSIIGTVVFGVSTIIFSTSTVADILGKIDPLLRNAIFSVIIVSMAMVIISVIFGLQAIQVKQYQFIIGSKYLSMRQGKKKKLISKYDNLRNRHRLNFDKLNELSKITLQNYLNSITRLDLRESLPEKFDQLVRDYFEGEKTDSLDRSLTFKEFSESTMPAFFKKKLIEYWKTPLDKIAWDFLDDYADKSIANFAENESKARNIKISYYVMVSTLGLISIALMLLFWSFNTIQPS